MDSLYRARSHAHSAACAEIVVDRGMEVGYCNSSGRTFFLADLTADAAVFTAELSLLAVIL